MEMVFDNYTVSVRKFDTGMVKMSIFEEEKCVVDISLTVGEAQILRTALRESVKACER